MTTSCCAAPGLLDARRATTATGSPKDRVPSPESSDGVVAADVAALGREHRHAGPLADDLELGDGVGALEVGGDEQRGVPLAP